MAEDRLYTDEVEVRCFIEGVYIPYIHKVFVNLVPSGSTATVELAPSPFLRTEMLCGAMIHIFYGDKRVKQLQTPNPGANGASSWPILFQGEVRRMGEMTQVGSSNIVLQCVSHSRSFSQTLLFFINDIQGQSAASLATQKGRMMAIGTTNFQIEHKDSVLSTGSRLRDRIIERFKDIKSTSKRFLALAGINNDILLLARDHSSYRIFQNKLRLNERFSAFVDPDVFRILDLEKYPDLLNNRVSTLPTYSSLREVLSVSTNMMQYSWLDIIQCSQSEVTVEELGKTPSLSSGPVKNEFYEKNIVTEDNNLVSIGNVTKDNVNEIQEAIESVIRGQDNPSFTERNTPISFDPGVGNIIFGRNQRSYFNREKVFTENPARFLTRDSFLQKVIDTQNKLVADTANPTKVAFQAVVDQGFVPFLPGVDDGSFKANESSQKIDLKKALRDERLRTQSQLNQFTSVPNLEFAMPPRCNVLLPSHTNNFSINIDGFGAPTRLFATAQLTPDASVVQWFMAPSRAAFFKVEDDGSMASLSQAQSKENEKNGIKVGNPASTESLGDVGRTPTKSQTKNRIP